MNKLILLSLMATLSCILLSCKQNTGDSGNEQQTENQDNVNKLPGLQPEMYYQLIEGCDYIDFIFHKLPFSMSQDEKSSIVANLRMIASDPVPQLNPQCNSMARISYMSNGEIMLEAELYFSQGCTYYVFIKDEKPFAANLMTQDGVVFYNNIISQVNSNPSNG